MPKQARSTSLVDDILEAAVRVLEREGAARFTTVRVAEQAGVSVGSLYQYFPNKEALLFKLQADEWQGTWSALDAILADPKLRPLARLRKAIVAFFRSEQEEARLRTALDDASPLFRDTPEARALEAKATMRMRAFIDEALPNAAPKVRAFAADFVFNSMAAVAETITTQNRSAAEVQTWAETHADLACTYLRRLTRPKR